MSETRDDARNPATQTRMRAAQNAGRIPISRELAGALAWTGSIAILVVLGPGLWESMSTWMRNSLGSWDVAAAADRSTNPFAGLLNWGVLQLVPFLLAIALAGFAALALQTRMAIFPELARPDLSRIHPVSGWRQIGSLTSWSAAFFGFLRLGLLLVTGWWIVTGDIVSLLELSGYDVRHQTRQLGEWATQAVLRLCVASIVVGGADYAFRSWWNHRSLRMTDQEIRDERRSMEPPPEIEARRRLIRERGRQDV
jgi:flagellar biosynthesis protein FlhB